MDLLIAEALAARETELFFYSPYHFLRAYPADQQLDWFVRGRVEGHVTETGAARVFTTVVDGAHYHFLYSHLAWDADFFARPVLKLFTVLYTDGDSERLTRAAQAFRQALTVPPGTYCFAELPAEDIGLIQALGRAGFGLIETRCTFYKDDLARYDHPRYPVRAATLAEAGRVGDVAAAMRNPFDRFHADHLISQADGDRFLRAYAEAAVRGTIDCATVLVPAEAGLPLDSFLAISNLPAHAARLGVGLARVLLTAVGPANRGWHLKLTSETIHYARERQAAYVLMTTQATNGAVFRTTEKLGWKLGGVGHVLSVGASLPVVPRPRVQG